MFNRVRRALLPLIRLHPRLYEAALDLQDRLRGATPDDRRRKALRRRVVSLSPEGETRGHVLLSLILEPFLVAEEEVAHHHTIHWEAREMARVWLEMGFAVDVILWTNSSFRPTRKYRVVIDKGHNLERLSRDLDADSIKVMHADAAHWLFHTTAQHQRLSALRSRRGVALRPVKAVGPNLGIESADCAVVLGNSFTVETFAFARKPIFQVPISTPITWPWPEGKDFEACRRRFLWFGSLGFVHKGLDLVLEAFRGLPDHHLTVCGPIDSEPEFVAAFRRELYETSNIETQGWIDVASQDFVDLARRTLAVVFPSCSEGGGGGVITCMHAGMLPVATRETSVDLGDFGLEILEDSVAGVRRAVRQLSALPAEDLEARARRAYDHVCARHTRKNFTRSYRRAARDILAQS